MYGMGRNLRDAFSSSDSTVTVHAYIANVYELETAGIDNTVGFGR